MNIITNQSNNFKMPKIRKQLTLETSNKQLELASTSPKESSLPYNVYVDKHTFSYFNKRSVQKHLKNLARVVQQQPKSQKNSRFIRSISQWIKPIGVKQEITNNQRVESNSSLSKQESRQSQPKAQNLKVAKQKSPYRVFPIFIKIEGDTKMRSKASHSACNLPQINNNQPNAQEAIVQSKLTNVNKKEKKKIDVLHTLKHKQFVQFLNKKKELLSNSLKLINKQMVSSNDYEK